MPAAKGKSQTLHRYRPASEYDDATLAQKREYWRNKKREQRARLSEQRQKPQEDIQKEKIPYLYVSAGVNASLSDSALSPPFQRKDDLNNYTSKTENRSSDSATSQKEDWLETKNVNTVMCNLQPTSCPVVSPEAKGGAVLIQCPTVMSVSTVVTSPTSSQTRPSTSSSGPIVRVTRITNGSSIKTEPQPCASMQGKRVPNTQLKAKDLLPGHITVSPTKMATDLMFTTSHSPVSSKRKDRTGPQSRTKSALVTTQRAEGFCSTQPSLESEEEKAAKRREQWRIKKREQRAKLAKVKEGTQSRDVIPQKLAAHKVGLMASSGLPSQLVLRGVSQKQCAVRVKVPFPAVRQETAKLQSGLASVAAANLQIDQVKAQNYVNRMAQTAFTAFDINTVKKSTEPQRSLSFLNHSFPRGIARCKTPRQRFIDLQKNFMNQRNLRYKSPLMASVFPTTAIPKIDPKDTPEQIIAKRREYWRVKKREQRAKLSMEMRSRAREKDSLIRRVKRYQQILAEMRKARALAHSTGSGPNPASETIGGFIKEDGTLTANIPKGLKNPNTAGVSKNISVIQQHRANMRRRGVVPVMLNQHSPAHHSFNLTDIKTPLLIKPPSQLNITTVLSPHLATQRVNKLTLTQPQLLQNAGSKPESNINGCVMKMAVSSHVPSLSFQDPALTEEERMAKKREYWRIKKREQRAARAVRVKHGLLQARSSAAMLKRKAQRQELATALQMNRSLNKRTGTTQNLLNSTTTVPTMPHVNQIKQESKSLPEADLQSPTQQAICPDIKPPTFPTAPPVPQLEPDPSVSTDSQVTTLLAVASMKKLLEESLSTVTDCQHELDTSTVTLEQDVKPDVSQLLSEKSQTSPAAPDLMLQIKCWEPASDVLEQKIPLNSKVSSSPEICETLPPLPACSEAVLSAAELSPPTTPVDVSLETPSGPAAPPRTQRFCSKETGQQNRCSPEPPKLHHISAVSSELSEPQHQHCGQQSPVQDRSQSSELPSPLRPCHVAAELGGLSSLQRKREYWKLMKRQQRARLRARQKERQGESSCRQRFLTNNQTPCLSPFKGVSPNKEVIRSDLSDMCGTSETSIPEVLVDSKASCDVTQSADTVQVKLPLTGREEEEDAGSSQHFTHFDEDSPQCYQDWIPRSSEITSTPSLPTLKPPDNPLPSVYLQPIQFPSPSLNPALSPIRIPCGEFQNPTNVVRSPTKLAPSSIMVPPRLIPGESEEDFLRRKREYWRIKKKEQRARKAVQDKGVNPMTVSNNWRPVLPVQDLETQETAAQDSALCMNPSEDSEHLMSMSMDPTSGPFTQSEYSAPMEGEAELLLTEFLGTNDEEGPLSEAVWRNRFLMDYNPLNQLLVCMVCGELQYSHSIDGVRAHIDEVHPHTLTLEPRERQHILEAWDEQVSKRERFFTSQLQQQQGGGVLAETYMN